MPKASIAYVKYNVAAGFALNAGPVCQYEIWKLFFYYYLFFIVRKFEFVFINVVTHERKKSDVLMFAMVDLTRSQDFTLASRATNPTRD